VETATSRTEEEPVIHAAKTNLCGREKKFSGVVSLQAQLVLCLRNRTTVDTNGTGVERKAEVKKFLWPAANAVFIAVRYLVCMRKGGW